MLHAGGVEAGVYVSGQRVPQRARRQQHQVARQTTCPLLARLYRVPANAPLAERMQFCNAVLGIPSIPTSPQMRLSSEVAGCSAPRDVNDEIGVVKCKAQSCPAGVAPAAVGMVWADTTVLELTLLAVNSVRTSVDQEYAHVLAPQDEAPHSAKAAASQEAKLVAREERARYVVELMAGGIDMVGQPLLYPIGTVELQQVVPGQPFLYPIRRAAYLDCNLALLDLAYNTGDPLFFTCTRLC